MNKDNVSFCGPVASLVIDIFSQPCGFYIALAVDEEVKVKTLQSNRCMNTHHNTQLNT